MPREALVLEVGSGGNPYPRANVLLDAYETTVERDFAPLIKDRPLVMGMIEKLPFRSQSFDFIIASHVLEHTAHPERFLGELMRVGKAGYIETPNAFFERLHPFRYHRLEIVVNDGTLHIFKKPSWRHDTNIVSIYERHVRGRDFVRFTSRRPQLFNVRYYWQGNIAFHVENPETDAGWPLEDTGSREPEQRISPLRMRLRELARTMFSQGRRNRQLNLAGVLSCPNCPDKELKAGASEWVCSGCASRYPVRKGVPVMFPKGMKPA